MRTLRWGARSLCLNRFTSGEDVSTSTVLYEYRMPEEHQIQGPRHGICDSESQIHYSRSALSSTNGLDPGSCITIAVPTIKSCGVNDFLLHFSKLFLSVFLFCLTCTPARSYWDIFSFCPSVRLCVCVSLSHSLFSSLSSVIPVHSVLHKTLRIVAIKSPPPHGEPTIMQLNILENEERRQDGRHSILFG